jgi:hypothetical protein
VWSRISNALKKLGFRSHNFLAQLLSETSRACTGRGCKPRFSNPFDFFDHTRKGCLGWQRGASRAKHPNRIAEKLRISFSDQMNRKVSPSELNAWRNSLQSFAHVLSHFQLADVGVVLEMQLPLTSRLRFLTTRPISAGCLTLTARKADRSRAISTGYIMGYRYARICILTASPAREETGALGCRSQFPHSQCRGKSGLRGASCRRFSCLRQERGTTILSQKEEPNAKS